MKAAQLQQLDIEISSWLTEGRKLVLNRMQQTIQVNEKTSRRDLVTNVDRENERFLVDHIRRFDPKAKILAEEGMGDAVTSLEGTVYIVDPIDGTMNFLQQHDHFAMMIGVYENGVGVYGAIMDVQNNHLYHGCLELGVYRDLERMEAPENKPLAKGLMGMSGPLALHNVYSMAAVVEASLGMRVYGSTGIEMTHILEGKLIGYVSVIKPWDIAAGAVLLNGLGLAVSKVDGEPLDMLSSNPVLVATRKAQEDILRIVRP